MHTHLPSYDEVISAFLDEPASPRLPTVATEPAWTELWAHRARHPGHSSNAYVVTHGLPIGPNG